MIQMAKFLVRRRRQLLLFCLTMVLVAAAGLTVAATSVPIPQTRVQSVTDGTVTGQGWDFPAGATFDIRLGVFGSRGAGGIVVGTTTVNADGTVAYSVPIPADLQGQRQIAIRLDGYQNYYSYAWFWNPAPAGEPGSTPPPSGENGQGGIPGYTGYPTFNIASADAAAHTVTINGQNFPPNQTFTFRINSMGTRGVNGAVVGTLDSGDGGAVTATFTLPADWHGFSQLAIRAESAAGYYAYNWFWTGVAAPAVAAPAPAGNGSAGTGGQPSGSGPASAGPATNGSAAPAAVYPTFSVASVARGTTVTIVTRNLPADTDFTVIMGEFGTQGLRGYQVAAFNSGDGGSQTLTFAIPAALANDNRIAIRLQGVGNPYFAYNWFWNS